MSSQQQIQNKKNKNQKKNLISFSERAALAKADAVAHDALVRLVKSPAFGEPIIAPPSAYAPWQATPFTLEYAERASGTVGHTTLDELPGVIHTVPTRKGQCSSFFFCDGLITLGSGTPQARYVLPGDDQQAVHVPYVPYVDDAALMSYGKIAQTSVRHRRALYRVRAERVGLSEKTDRRVTVACARKAKQALHHDLYGLEQQAGSWSPQFKFTHSMAPELQGVFSQMSDGVPINVKLDPTVITALARLNETFKEVFSQANYSATTASNFVGTSIRSIGLGADRVLNSLEDSLAGITKLLWMIPLLGAAYFACTTVPVFKTVAATAAIILVVSSVLPADLWDAIKCYWPTSVASTQDEVRTEFEAQAGGFVPSNLGHIITMGLTYLAIGKRDGADMIKGLMKEMPSYGRNVDSWSKLSTFILETIESFLNTFRASFDKPAISLINTGVKHVDDWCRRVMTLLTTAQTGGELMEPSVVQGMIALRNEGRDLTDLYRFTRDVSPLLHKYLGQLDDLCRTCSAAMHSFKGGRPQPAVLCLTGKPGVGKTFLCKMITNLVLKHFIPLEEAKRLDYNFDSQVFVKGPTEYWNGYASQFAVVYDDFGQKVPAAGSEESDYMDLIRVANCWSYPLNFADVENKGKNFFKSRFILLTTNIVNIDNCQKVIVEPGAITRRIDHGYQLTVHPDFSCDGKLDYQKVSKYSLENGDFPYDAWIFKKYLFAVGNEARVIDHTPYTLLDVVGEVVASLAYNKLTHGDNEDLMKDILKRTYGVLEGAANIDEEAMVDILRGQPLGGIEEVDETLECQGGEFFQFLKRTNDANVAVLGHMLNESDKYVSWRKPLVELQKLGTLLLDYNRSFLFEVFKIHDSPLATFLMSTAMVMLLIAACKTMLSTVIGWFSPVVEKAHVIWNSIRKKKKLPEGVLAQAIDSLHPSDFMVAELQSDGSFEEALKFTPEVLLRAYERLTGVTAQSNEPNNYVFRHNKVRGTKVISSDIEIQGDLVGCDIAELCARNMYRFTVVTEAGFQTLGQIIMVQGSVGIMPEHFLSIVNEGLVSGLFNLTDSLTLTHPFDKGVRITYKIRDFLGFKRTSAPRCDCVAIRFESLRAHRQLTKHFLTVDDLRYLPKIRMRLDNIEGEDSSIHRVRLVEAKRVDRFEYGGGETSHVVHDGYEYLGYTRRGDCGGIVTLQECPSLACRRIIGFHVAGSETNGRGFCNIITKDKLDILLAGFQEIAEIFPQSESVMTMLNAPVVGSFLGLNKTERTYNMNPASSLERTPLHNMWGTYSKVPAKLAPFVSKLTGERVVPMLEAIKGYASPVLHFEAEHVKQAAYHAFEKVREYTLTQERKVYSFEEAVSGVEGTNVNGIPRSTSPGYPFVLDGVTNKKSFFGGDGPYQFDGTKAQDTKVRVLNIVNKAKENVRLEHVYVDFLKDELRAPEKVAAGKSRLISAAPMDYVIAFRMYFLAFTSAVQDTRIHNGVAVGINHYSEWDVLARKMKSKGRCTVAGDFKGFDTGEQPQLLWAILDEINDWYDDGPVNALIRRVLWLEVVHSRHFGGLGSRGEYLYQWNKSLSSGHPATSIINSFYGLILFVLTWMDVMGPNRAHEFWYHVYACTYGDDNVLNIDEAVVGDYNQKSITVAMLKYGMEYTNERKAGDVADYRSLEEISFLKRGFRYEPTLRCYVGPLDMESVLFTSYWARSKKNMVQNVKDNIEFSWTELALHEPSVWDTHADVMRRGYKQAMDGEPIHYFSRAIYLRRALDLVPSWNK